MTTAAWRYAKKSGEILGPVSTKDLRDLALAGTLRRDDMIQKEGTSEWTPAGSFRGILFAEDTPPESASPTVTKPLVLPPPVKPSSKASAIASVGKEAGDFVLHFVRMLFIALALIIVGIAAASVFTSMHFAGNRLAHLSSVAGNTIAESFYQQIGEFIKAFSWFAVLMTCMLSSIA